MGILILLLTSMGYYFYNWLHWRYYFYYWLHWGYYFYYWTHGDIIYIIIPHIIKNQFYWLR
jgi:hypothetical protein